MTGVSASVGVVWVPKTATKTKGDAAGSGTPAKTHSNDIPKVA